VIIILTIFCFYLKRVKPRLSSIWLDAMRPSIAKEIVQFANLVSYSGGVAPSNHVLNDSVFGHAPADEQVFGHAPADEQVSIA
jgi:hypothetical protein